MLVLPFVGKILTIPSMLPDENTNLKMLEKLFTYEKFIKWIKSDMMHKRRWKFSFLNLNWKTNTTGGLPFTVWK